MSKYTELCIKVEALLNDCEETEALSLVYAAYEAEEILAYEMRELEAMCGA